VKEWKIEIGRQTLGQTCLRIASSSFACAQIGELGHMSSGKAACTQLEGSYSFMATPSIIQRRCLGPKNAAAESGLVETGRRWGYFSCKCPCKRHRCMAYLALPSIIACCQLRRRLRPSKADLIALRVSVPSSDVLQYQDHGYFSTPHAKSVCKPLNKCDCSTISSVITYLQCHPECPIKGA
jgi:hypothetical protein